jgi:hypothetical protein
MHQETGAQNKYEEEQKPVAVNNRQVYPHHVLIHSRAREELQTLQNHINLPEMK